MAITVKESKKIVRTRKTTVTAATSALAEVPAPLALLNPLIEFLTSLAQQADTLKEQVLTLQKSMNESRDSWNEEQKRHEEEIKYRNEALARERKREDEEYTYQQMMERKKAEDAFAEKKMVWEKELADQKETIASERRELAELRKKVTAFDDEIAKAVTTAKKSLSEELEEQYSFERKLREQEVKSDKELLALRITSLSSEHSRQTTEAERLKKSLEDAMRQLKEIAVKVIEGKAPKQETVNA